MAQLSVKFSESPILLLDPMSCTNQWEKKKQKPTTMNFISYVGTGHTEKLHWRGGPCQWGAKLLGQLSLWAYCIPVPPTSDEEPVLGRRLRPAGR